MSRAVAALALLLVVSGVQLGDALLGGDLVGTPVLALGTVLAGYLVGLTSRWRLALGGVLVAATALSAAHQVAAPGAYPVLDDFVFSLLVVGAPALGGAVVRGRASQVRELRRVAALLEEQREAEVRAARLEERNRVEMRLHRGFSEQVAAIAMRAESAVGVEDEAARGALADVEAAARRSLDELREALGSLRDEPDPEPDPAPPVGEDAPRRPEVTSEPLGRPDLALGLAVGAAVAVESVVSPQAHGPAVLNVLLALLAAGPLVVRRQRPLLACAATLGAFAVMAAWLTPPTAMVTPILPVLICGYVVGAHLRGWWRVPGLLLVLGGLALVAWAAPGDLPSAADAVPMLVFTLIAALMGVVAAGWSRRAAELTAAVAELERGRDVAVGLAVAEQRNRLAGELHDTVAHAMTVICLQASAGQVRRDPATLDAILDAARSSLHELRNGLDNLGDDHELGLAGITAQARRSGLRPDVHVSGRIDDLPADTRRLAVRVVREALTNAGRYAPGAGVHVDVTATDDALRLSVADDGAEGPPVGGLGAGSGLAALAAEVEGRGGTLAWGRSGAGFLVEATLPGIEVLV